MRDENNKLVSVPAKYQGLKVTSANYSYRLLDEDFNDLSEEIMIAPDESHITNFKREEEKGTVSFDIFVKRVPNLYLNGPGTNSTNHDLTVTGHVTAKVIKVID